MSVYASRWALDHLTREDCPLSVTARGVFLALAAEANYRTGYATTGQGRLARLLGVHPDTVYRAVRELRRWAQLPVTEVTGKGLRWHFPTSEVVPTPRADAGGQFSTPPALTRSTPRAGAGGPPAPARGKGLGTYVEEEGRARPVERAE